MWSCSIASRWDTYSFRGIRLYDTHTHTERHTPFVSFNDKKSPIKYGTLSNQPITKVTTALTNINKRHHSTISLAAVIL